MRFVVSGGRAEINRCLTYCRFHTVLIRTTKQRCCCRCFDIRIADYAVALLAVALSHCFNCAAAAAMFAGRFCGFCFMFEWQCISIFNDFSTVDVFTYLAFQLMVQCLCLNARSRQLFGLKSQACMSDGARLPICLKPSMERWGRGCRMV